MNSCIETDRFPTRFLRLQLSSFPRMHVAFDSALEGLRAINRSLRFADGYGASSFRGERPSPGVKGAVLARALSTKHPWGRPLPARSWLTGLAPLCPACYGQRGHFAN